MSPVISAMKREIELQAEKFTAPIKTLYFGGGTPSVLSLEDIELLVETISQNYKLDLDEVSFEANPEDLNKEYLSGLRSIGVDRLSIGVQSFDDNMLKFINRNHNSAEALKSIEHARSSGFSNINLDLIYALPGSDNSVLSSDLSRLIKIYPEHVSIYAYTVEPRTVFENWLNKGQIELVENNEEADQFLKIMAELRDAGFEQYEVSNFTRDGKYSRHNSNYWNLSHYLGIGPSAHSYRNDQRWVNPSHNIHYLRSIEAGELPGVYEERGCFDEVNEYIFTSLRTIWGCDLEMVRKRWNLDIRKVYNKELETLRREGMIHGTENRILLTEIGFLHADNIAGNLFFV